METVGVGQAEVEIASNADTTVVVVNPGWGDSVQAAKAGLLEIGDIFVVNKADRSGVSETVRDLTQMLELGGEREWNPPILPTVAVTGEGVPELWVAIAEHRSYLEASETLAEVRRARLVAEMESSLMVGLRNLIRQSLPAATWTELTQSVAARNLDPWSAADRVLHMYNGRWSE